MYKIDECPALSKDKVAYFPILDNCGFVSQSSPAIYICAGHNTSDFVKYAPIHDAVHAHVERYPSGQKEQLFSYRERLSVNE